MQVYESLRRSAEFPKEKLTHFDSEGAEELLYEMRNLGVNLRPATAEYIADNDLDPYVRPRTPAASPYCWALPATHGLLTGSPIYVMSCHGCSARRWHAHDFSEPCSSALLHASLAVSPGLASSYGNPSPIRSRAGSRDNTVRPAASRHKPVQWPTFMERVGGVVGASLPGCFSSHTMPQEATTLSRAVREHGRRMGEKEGFSIAPGDCLAFKYYRDVSCPLLRSLSSKAVARPWLMRLGCEVGVALWRTMLPSSKA